VHPPALGLVPKRFDGRLTLTCGPAPANHIMPVTGGYSGGGRRKHPANEVSFHLRQEGHPNLFLTVAENLMVAVRPRASSTVGPTKMTAGLASVPVVIDTPHGDIQPHRSSSPSATQAPRVQGVLPGNHGKSLARKRLVLAKNDIQPGIAGPAPEIRSGRQGNSPRPFMKKWRAWADLSCTDKRGGSSGAVLGLQAFKGRCLAIIDHQPNGVPRIDGRHSAQRAGSGFGTMFDDTTE